LFDTPNTFERMSCTDVPAVPRSAVAFLRKRCARRLVQFGVDAACRYGAFRSDPAASPKAH